MKSARKKAAGGEVESPKTGDADYKADEKTKNDRYTFESKVNDEAEERKRGGRAKKKEGGKVKGCAPMARADRKPRKSGGRTGSNSNPLSSAHAGKPAKGRSVEQID